MQQKFLLFLQYILICTALFFTGASNAGENTTPIKLDMANGSQKVTNAILPGLGHRLIYSLTPSTHHTYMIVTIESSNELVGFTVWDAGSHFAEPIAAQYKEPLSESHIVEVESRIANTVWRGDVRSREHEIIIENEGHQKATFTLNVTLQ